MLKNGKRTLIAGLLAAGLVGAGTSWAQAGAPGEGPEGIGPVRGFERLHRGLKLNAKQEELWKTARDTQQAAFRAMRARNEDNRAKLRAEIDKPGADLKKFSELRDQLRTQTQAQMETARAQARAAWFAVYDALDATQKEQVRVAIRDGMDRRSRGPRGGFHGGPRAGFGSEPGKG